MALTVEHLNADTTFLLTFTPAIAPRHVGAQFPGSFTILIDPWLCGPSSVWKPSFQISHHTTESSINSLRDITLPDLIIISQDKPDHCHKETLCTLPASSKVKFLATPAAAKKIRSWNHFKNATFDIFETYVSERNSSLHRITIPGYTNLSPPGEVTVAYLPAKMDMTRLHNAIGITYRAPSSQTTAPSGDLVNLFNLPLSPLTTEINARPSPRQRSMSRQRSTSRQRSMSRQRSIPTLGQQDPQTPPDSPMEGQTSSSYFPQPEKERTLSVLYSPHGVASSVIAPYAANHLAKESALPFTALFHSVNTETNPWLLGGIVAAGYPGGAELIRKFGAHCWISAHDEAKENKGWSTAWIKSTRYTVDEAQKKLEQESSAGHEEFRGKKYRKAKMGTKVINLEPGEMIRVPDELPEYFGRKEGKKACV